MGIDNLLEMVRPYRRDAGAEGQPQPLRPRRRHRGPAGQGPRPCGHPAGAERHPASGRRHHRRHRRGPCPRHDQRPGPEGRPRPAPPCLWRSSAWARCPARATTSTPWPTSAWPGSWWSSASTSRRRPPPAPCGKVTLEDLFSQIQAGRDEGPEHHRQGRRSGLRRGGEGQSLEKLSNDEVRVRVIHCAVGAISESDVMLATTSGAIIVGFNVRPDTNAKETAARHQCGYAACTGSSTTAIDEIEAAMKGMLAPKFREVDLGRAEVRKVLPHHRRGHGGRLLRAGRQDAARRPDAPAAGRHRHLRRRHRLPPALQGQRQGGGRRATSAASPSRSSRTSRRATSSRPS